IHVHGATSLVESGLLLPRTAESTLHSRRQSAMLLKKGNWRTRSCLEGVTQCGTMFHRRTNNAQGVANNPHERCHARACSGAAPAAEPFVGESHEAPAKR